MLTHYLTIKTNGEHEFEIKKSRFICQLARVADETSAQKFIAACKKKHYKATHNCSAYLIGEHDEYQRAHDDGEPVGTAGVPMLEVLRREHLKNVVAVTTRYFGGIKLGAGGLIRAYSNSVSQALAQIGLVEGKLQQTLLATIDYAQLGKVNHYLETENIAIIDTTYLTQVTLTLSIDQNRLKSVQTQLTDLLAGQVAFKLGDKSYHEIAYHRPK